MLSSLRARLLQQDSKRCTNEIRLLADDKPMITHGRIEKCEIVTERKVQKQKNHQQESENVWSQGASVKKWKVSK